MYSSSNDIWIDNLENKTEGIKIDQISECNNSCIICVFFTTNQESILNKGAD